MRSSAEVVSIALVANIRDLNQIHRLVIIGCWPIAHKSTTVNIRSFTVRYKHSVDHIFRVRIGPDWWHLFECFMINVITVATHDPVDNGNIYRQFLSRWRKFDKKR